MYEKKIKTIVIFILLNLSISIFVFARPPELAVPPGWKMVHDVDGVKVFNLISNTDITGSFENRKTDTKMDWSNKKWPQYLKSLEEEKKKVLALVDISEWKAGKYDWKEKSDHHQLLLEGTYKNPANEAIAFKEVHLYFPDKTVQILHTRPVGVKNGKKHAETIIDYLMNVTLKKKLE